MLAGIVNWMRYAWKALVGTPQTIYWEAHNGMSVTVSVYYGDVPGPNHFGLGGSVACTIIERKTGPQHRTILVTIPSRLAHVVLSEYELKALTWYAYQQFMASPGSDPYDVLIPGCISVSDLYRACDEIIDFAHDSLMGYGMDIDSLVALKDHIGENKEIYLLRRRDYMDSRNN